MESLKAISVEIGHFALILSFSLSLAQAVLPILGACWGDLRLMKTGQQLAFSSLFLILLSFFSLMLAYFQSDFSVANVWENSHSLEPGIYKLTGTWASHEGSMLLWVLALNLFSTLFAFLESDHHLKFKAYAVGTHGGLNAAFCLFIILTSNPFIRMPSIPMEGKDLNPLLQHIGLAFHPPLLYLGYAGFSVCFSCAVAALLEEKPARAWAHLVRPWILISWALLTGGITIGSWWAYRELGWGGFWFWDPVENLSLIPWLSGIALFHSLAIIEKRGVLSSWGVLLSIIIFLFCLIGTFLVRSGMLTSVHSFAEDPERGIFLLLIVIVAGGGALLLFALRSHLLRGTDTFRLVSREGFLIVNNLLLLTAVATVSIGTFYPVFYELMTGKRISVGPPFFNMVLLPLALPILAMMPVGSFLAWKKGNFKKAIISLIFPLIIALFSILITLALLGKEQFFASLLIGFAVWVIFGSIVDPVSRFVKTNSLGTKKGGSRNHLDFFNRITGTTIAHCGVGILFLGIIGASLFDEEVIVALNPGESIKIAGYNIKFQEEQEIKGTNYIEHESLFEVIGQRKSLKSSRRFYPARKIMTSESGVISTGWGSQLYIAVGDREESGGKRIVRLWSKPMVSLIWIGGIIIMMGGGYALVDRRQGK